MLPHIFEIKYICYTHLYAQSMRITCFKLSLPKDWWVRKVYPHFLMSNITSFEPIDDPDAFILKKFDLKIESRWSKVQGANTSNVKHAGCLIPPSFYKKKNQNPLRTRVKVNLLAPYRRMYRFGTELFKSAVCIVISYNTRGTGYIVIRMGDRLLFMTVLLSSFKLIWL